MLTRFVRIQLTIFTIVRIIGVAVMVFNYMQVPTLLGIGRMKVTLELPETGGLYRFSNVTYRGVEVGKVTGVALTPHGVKATLSLTSSSKIPANLQAEVRSISAVGEQYVDLLPRTDSPPYLHDGSVIAMQRHHDSASRRAHARSGQHADQQHPPRGTQPIARRVVQRLQRSRIRPGIAFRLRGKFRDLNGVPADPKADRRQRAAAGLPGTDNRFHPAMGAQPRRGHG